MLEIVAGVRDDGQSIGRQDAIQAERQLGAADPARQCEHGTVPHAHRKTPTSPSPPPGAERVGVRWRIPERLPTRPPPPSPRCALRPSPPPPLGGGGRGGASTTLPPTT